MIKLVYKPLGMLVSVLGGILAGAIFKKVRTIAALAGPARYVRVMPSTVTSQLVFFTR